MPITKSAKKSLRSSLAKQAQNTKLRKNLEISLKKVTATTISDVVSVIDKAAKRGIIHVNKAARIKSGLAKKFKATGLAKRASAGAKVAKAAKPKAATAKAAPKKTVTKKKA